VVIVASLTLRWTETSGASPVLPLLCFLFVAGMLRSVSAWCLSRQTELTGWRQQARESFLPREDVAAPSSGFDARTWQQLFLFLVLMQFAVYISSAFFTPFKLRALDLNYARFSVLVICAYVGKILALGLAGQLARRWGGFRLLLFGAIGIVPMAGLWSVSQNFAWLMSVQLCSGMMWACYELAIVMVFVELVPRARRMQLLSRYNVANSLAMVGGTTVGAALFAWLGQGYAAYLALFIGSSACRLLSLAVFPAALLRDPGHRGPARSRLLLFSYPFEALGRAVFRPWQSVDNEAIAKQDRESRAA
jgi:MFS family permease